MSGEAASVTEEEAEEEYELDDSSDVRRPLSRPP
jgi:hypothetical protein